MSWISWLETRIGFLGIPRLMQMIAVLNGLVYVLHLFQPDFVFVLTLSPERILHGEIWRIVSYIFVPEIFLLPGGNPMIQSLFFFLYLWFLIWMGDALEHAWGAFRLTLFYVLGMLGITIAAFFFGDGRLTFYLNLSLFFAFATLYPDVQIYLLLVIPVKMKWAALISLAGILLGFFLGSLSEKARILVSFTNYFIFFGPLMVTKFRHKVEVDVRRKKFESKTASPDDSLHRCVICKKTEKDNPELEFRVARDGEEYCVAHLPR